MWSIQAAIFAADLKPVTKLVLLALASHANQHGDGVWPSIGRLMELTSLSRASVKSHIRLAEEAGWVEAIARHRDDGGQASNLYRLLPPERSNPDHPPGQDLTTPRSAPDPHELTNRTKSDTDVSDIDVRFSAWWNEYPRKVGKRAAEKMYHRLVASGEVTPEALQAGVERYAKSKSVAAGFVCLPTTWLNQGRWDDEVQAAASAAAWWEDDPNALPARKSDTSWMTTDA